MAYLFGPRTRWDRLLAARFNFVHRQALVLMLPLIVKPWSLLVLASFALLCWSVRAGWLRQWDILGIEFLQSFGSTSRDCAAVSLGWIGSPELAIATVLILAWWLWKKVSFVHAYCLLFVFALVTGIEIAGKQYINQFPPYAYHRFCEPGLPSALLTVDMPGSFPSGHMLRAGYLLALVLKWSWVNLIRRRALILIMVFVLTAAIAVSRVYIGDHWISDVAGGILLAWVAALWTDLSPHGEFRS
ncbi:MAG: phosphatase PAP2 family protein [Elusimicrobia bacterium]|nr:phosphatase PAP2 family protein [Elusimicrobiota bacterium]